MNQWQSWNILKTSDQPVCRLTKCQRDILRDGKPQPAASVLEAMCHGFPPMAVSATASNNRILWKGRNDKPRTYRIVNKIKANNLQWPKSTSHQLLTLGVMCKLPFCCASSQSCGLCCILWHITMEMKTQLFLPVGHVSRSPTNLSNLSDLSSLLGTMRRPQWLQGPRRQGKKPGRLSTQTAGARGCKHEITLQNSI